MFLLCCIWKDLNFGVTSIETQSITLNSDLTTRDLHNARSPPPDVHCELHVHLLQKSSFDNLPVSYKCEVCSELSDYKENAHYRDKSVSLLISYMMLLLVLQHFKLFDVIVTLTLIHRVLLKSFLIASAAVTCLIMTASGPHRIGVYEGWHEILGWKLAMPTVARNVNQCRLTLRIISLWDLRLDCKFIVVVMKCPVTP